MKTIDLGGPVRIQVEDFTYGLDERFYKDANSAGVIIAMEDGTDDGDETIDTYLIPTWGSETVLQVLARYFPHETDANGMMTAIWTPEYRSDTPGWCQAPRRPTDQPSKALWCRHALSTADWWNVYTDGLGDGSEGFQDTLATPGATALFRFNQDSDLDGFSDRSEARLGTDPDDASSFPKPEMLAGVHNIGTFTAGSRVTSTLSLLNTGFYDAYGVEAVMVAPDDSVTIDNNTVGGSGRVRSQKQVIVGSRILLQNPLPAAWTQANHAVPAAGGYYTGTVDRTYTFTVNCATAGGCKVGEGDWTLAWNNGAGATGSRNFGATYKSPTFLPVGSEGLTLALYSGSVQPGESFTVAANTPRDTFQYTINRTPYTEPIVIVSYNDPQGNHRFVVPPQAMRLTAPTDNLQQFAGQMLAGAGVEIVTQQPFAAGSNTVQLLVNNPTDKTLQDAHLFLEFIDISGTVVSEVPTQVTLPPGPSYTPSSYFLSPISSEDYIVMAFLTDYQGNILDTAGRPLSSFQADPLPKLAVDGAALTWDFGTVAQGSLLKRPLSLANTGYGALATWISPTVGLSLSRGAAGQVGAADSPPNVLTLRTGDLPVGPVDRMVTIQTSDPLSPTVTLRLVGTITAPAGDTAGGSARPLDVPVTVTGPKSQGEWVEFTHTLGPEPPSLHPVKVWNSSVSALVGYGYVARMFGPSGGGGRILTDFAVPARPDNGTPSGVTINVGDKLVFSSGGTWCWGGGGDCSGVTGTPGRPRSDELPVTFPGYQFGYLFGRIANWAIPIGTGTQVESPVTGELVLLMNDRVGHYNDNTGAVQVTVDLSPGFVAQQGASTDVGQVRLHANAPQAYVIQYGRRFDFAIAADTQLATLRVPAGTFTVVTLDALISGLPANATFALDIAADSSNEWSGTVANASTNTSPDLAAAFNAYWVAQGAPVTGNLDVPVKVTLSQPGQVLLTNLQVTTAGSKQRAVRLPSGSYSHFTLDFTVGGTGSGARTVALDVGADGSIDWNYSGSPTLPVTLKTGNLAAAINAYLAGKSGAVDVPLRFFVAPDAPVTLADYAATRIQTTDLAANSISLGTVERVANSLSAAPAEERVGNSLYNAGDIVPVQATLRNAGSQASGPVTAAFFAHAEGWGDWYIGSAFFSDIAPGATVQGDVRWDTTGFSGTVPVKVVVNPYGRVAESSQFNNTAVTTATVLGPTGAVLAIDPPTATAGQGQRVSVDIVVRTDQPVDGAAAYLDFDRSKLQVAAITPGGALPSVLQNSFDNAAGRIGFAAGALTNPPASGFVLATVTFTATGLTPGTPLTFASIAPRRSDVTADGGSILDHTEGGSVIVENVTATLLGHVTPPGNAHWQIPLAVTLSTQEGGPPLATFTPTADQSGYFTVTGIAPGGYRVGVKGANTLRNTQTTTLAAGANTLELGALRAGDANDDNCVLLVDFSILRGTFGKCQGDAGYDPRADFNGDACVTLPDFSLLRMNFGVCGDATARAAADTPATNVATMSVVLDAVTVTVGQPLTLTVRVDPAGQPVDGAAAYLTFDPAVVQVMGVTAGDALPLTLQNEFDNTVGRIAFAAGTLDAAADEVFDLAIVRLQAVSAGSTAFTFERTPPRATEVTALGASVLQEVVDNQLTVESGGEPSQGEHLFLPFIGSD